MGKRILLTLLILTSISALTGKRMQEGSSSLDKAGLDRPDIVTDAGLAPLIEDFEAYVNYRIEEEQIPGVAVAIVRDSQIIYLKGFGLRELQGYDPVDYHTVFRLGSVSKGFAPVLTGILVQEGVLDWDDKVIDYLPEFELKDPRNTRELTLRHLLSHTSGLPRHTYTNLLDDGVPFSDIVGMLRNVKLTDRVGRSYNYQNVAYSLISEVVEKATGKSYRQLLREHLFAPLEMRDASASFEGIISRNNRAIPHLPGRHGYKRIDLSPNYYDAGPAAGVNASITDMAKWMSFLLGSRPDVLTDSLLAEVFRPHVAIPNRDKVLGNWRRLIDKAHYAMGWRVLDCGRDTLLYHGGYVNGYRSEIALNREDGIGIAVLTNAPSYFISDCLPAFFGMYEHHKATQDLLKPLLSSR